MDDVVANTLDAVARGDWRRVREVLHPYLHWSGRTGQTVRGRNNVVLFLQTSPPLLPPLSFELRDGQIYRWAEPAG
jgi:hypothetical protein